ncbi:MAG: ABC transporter ATP-binding protein [Rickettsiaceae bacterium]|nr:ABC transporter ATP-binding protein [Rickettsiaceae bacterium]
MSNIISCRGLSKSFGLGDSLVHVLKDINFTVDHGEFLMIVGPSGCGKTTLLSIIAGILGKYSGNCLVDGNDYNNMSEKEIIKFRAKNIGFIFQSLHLIPSLNVIENASIPLIIQGMARSDAAKETTEILEFVGLGNKMSKLPELLSGGEKQRVAITRALIHRPKIVICDEPTSSLDINNGKKTIEFMRSINKKYNTTFVVVTHDSRILNYADRIIHIDDGVITKEEQLNNVSNVYDKVKE